jgi:hypothetical protein
MNKLQAQLNNQLNNHHHHHHHHHQLANYVASIGNKIGNLASYVGQASAAIVSSSPSPISTISTTQTSIMPSRQITTTTANSYPKNLSLRSPSITPEPPSNHQICEIKNEAHINE